MLHLQLHTYITLKIRIVRPSNPPFVFTLFPLLQ